MSYFESVKSALPYWSDEYMLQSAEQKGCTVEYPTEEQLFIDIDSEADFETFQTQLALLESLGLVGVESYTIRPSKSGGEKRHIVVTTNVPMTILERIALQAVLGSDRKRELLSLTGLANGQTHPTVFFRPKEG